MSRLKIKPYFLTNASIDEESVLSSISSTTSLILQGDDYTLISYENIYREIYRAVLQNRGGAVLETVLSSTRAVLCTHYAVSTKDDLLLKSILSSHETFTRRLKSLLLIFTYFSSTFLAQQRHPPLQETLLTMFYDECVVDLSTRSHLKSHLESVLLSHLFDCYDNESPVLADLENFFKTILQPQSLSTKVFRLSSELQMTKTVEGTTWYSLLLKFRSLYKTNCKLFNRLVPNEILQREHHVHLLSEFKMILTQSATLEFYKMDIDKTLEFFQLTSWFFKELQQYGVELQSLQTLFNEPVFTLLSSPLDNFTSQLCTTVEPLLKLFDMLSSWYSVSLANMELFLPSIRALLNTKTTRLLAQFLDKYIGIIDDDLLLQNDNTCIEHFPLRFTSLDVQHIITVCVDLWSLLPDKSEFDQVYYELMSRRWIQAHFHGETKERLEKMLAKEKHFQHIFSRKQEKGSPYALRFEMMLRDLAGFLKHHQDHSLLNVMVLTPSCWPITTPTSAMTTHSWKQHTKPVSVETNDNETMTTLLATSTFSDDTNEPNGDEANNIATPSREMLTSVPSEVALELEHFQSQYLSLHTGRKLSFTMEHMTVEMLYFAPNKTYTLNIPALCACLLLSLNHHRPTLIPNHPYLIPLQDLGFIVGNTTEGYMLNSEYNSETSIVHIDRLVDSETLSFQSGYNKLSEQQNDAFQQDTLLLDARIVRCMKQSRQLSQSELLKQINSDALTFSVPLIRKRIDALISREFLERHPNDKKVYIYKP